MSDSRKAAYVRWRIKEGKEITEEQRKFLAEHEESTKEKPAKEKPAKEKKEPSVKDRALARIAETSKTQLKKISKEALVDLGFAAGCDREDLEATPKDALIDKLKLLPS